MESYGNGSIPSACLSLGRGGGGGWELKSGTCAVCKGLQFGLSVGGGVTKALYSEDDPVWGGGGGQDLLRCPAKIHCGKGTRLRTLPYLSVVGGKILFLPF